MSENGKNKIWSKSVSECRKGLGAVPSIRCNHLFGLFHLQKYYEVRNANTKGHLTRLHYTSI